MCHDFLFLSPSKLTGTLKEPIAVAADPTFSDSELESLQKLDFAIYNAFLEAKEFALYSVLEILLGLYARSFTIFKDQTLVSRFTLHPKTR